MKVVKKAFSRDPEEVKRLEKQGYIVVSISYFVSNPVPNFTLEKVEEVEE